VPLGVPDRPTLIESINHTVIMDKQQFDLPDVVRAKAEVESGASG